MQNLSSQFIGAVRRCVGDAVVPAHIEIELVAAKIWHDCMPGRVNSADWPVACNDQEFYRRAAWIALQGRPQQMTR